MRLQQHSCENCGDGSGWSVWRTRELPGNKPVLVWAACADCNDDGDKPKPEMNFCEGCGEWWNFCTCGFPRPK
jgi:hypothetical protein